MKNGISDWLIVAQEDMLVADELLKVECVPTGAVTFHCQQAIEKYFKAFLLDNGWKLKKIHNLQTLYTEIKKIKDLSLDIDIITKIYDKYSETRYPDDYNPPTEEQAREFYKFALEVEEIIKKELGE
jgi:HEPN domain-containing protein